MTVPLNGTISTLGLYFLMVSFNWSPFVSPEELWNAHYIFCSSLTENTKMKERVKICFQGRSVGKFVLQEERAVLKLKVFPGRVQGWGSDAVNNSGVCIQISSTFRAGESFSYCMSLQYFIKWWFHVYVDITFLEIRNHSSINKLLNHDLATQVSS